MPVQLRTLQAHQHALVNLAQQEQQAIDREIAAYQAAIVPLVAAVVGVGAVPPLVATYKAMYDDKINAIKASYANQRAALKDQQAAEIKLEETPAVAPAQTTLVQRKMGTTPYDVEVGKAARTAIYNNYAELYTKLTSILPASVGGKIDKITAKEAKINRSMEKEKNRLSSFSGDSNVKALGEGAKYGFGTAVVGTIATFAVVGTMAILPFVFPAVPVLITGMVAAAIATVCLAVVVGLTMLTGVFGFFRKQYHQEKIDYDQNQLDKLALQKKTETVKQTELKDIPKFTSFDHMAPNHIDKAVNDLVNVANTHIHSPRIDHATSQSIRDMTGTLQATVSHHQNNLLAASYAVGAAK